MTQPDPPSQETLDRVARLVGSESEARELVETLSDEELRMLLRAQEAPPGSEEELAAMTDAHLAGAGVLAGRGEQRQRLQDAWPDPYALAAALPRAKVAGVAGQVALSLFLVGCLLAVLLLTFALTPPIAALVVDVGAIAVYLLLRVALKRWGLFSTGAVTVAQDGTVRFLAGLGSARRRARGTDDHRVSLTTWGFAALFLIVVLGVPVTLTVVLDLPELIWGWLIMACLALNEMTLLAIRVRADASDRRAERVDGTVGLVLAADFLRRGGDAGRLTDGLSISELLPQEENRRIAVLSDALTRLSIAEAGQ